MYLFNYYVIFIYKFYVSFKICNLIKFISCAKFIGHITYLKIVKSRMMKLTVREKSNMICVLNIVGCFKILLKR
jgi:hypothetical protein